MGKSLNSSSLKLAGSCFLMSLLGSELLLEGETYLFLLASRREVTMLLALNESSLRELSLLSLTLIFFCGM